MAKFLFRVAFSEQGMERLIEDGGLAISEGAQLAIEHLGGALENLHFTLGSNDALAIVDLPDEIAASSLSLAITSAGLGKATVEQLLSASTVAQSLHRARVDPRWNLALAVEDPAIAGAFRAAASNVGVAMTALQDERETFQALRSQRRTVLVIEDAPGYSVQRLANTAAALHHANGREIVVTIVTRFEPKLEDRSFSSVTDWLVWPSSIAHVETKVRQWITGRAVSWHAAATPADERTRLKTLRGLELLDTEPEGRFDQITASACARFGVPIALVSLVDTARQWFKSVQGLDVRETPRDASLCAHAILGDRIFQVPDTHQDSRFAENPLVTGAPGIRFYAGTPLRVRGSRVGTLCLVDIVPKTLDENQLQELAELGRLVEAELLNGTFTSTA